MIKQILQSAKRMSNVYHQKLASKKHSLVFHNFKGYLQIIQSFVNGLKKNHIPISEKKQLSTDSERHFHVFVFT